MSLSQNSAILQQRPLASTGHWLQEIFWQQLQLEN
jgi:hypothetical protein